MGQGRAIAKSRNPSWRGNSKLSVHNKRFREPRLLLMLLRLLLLYIGSKFFDLVNFRVGRERRPCVMEAW